MLFFFILFSCFPVYVTAKSGNGNDTLIFSDSSLTYIVNTAAIDRAVFSRIISAPSQKKRMLLENILDSLGFFHARFDTLTTSPFRKQHGIESDSSSADSGHTEGTRQTVLTDEAENVVCVLPGSRAFIDTIIIENPYHYSIDSVQDIRFPIEYDAGVVNRLAYRTVSFFANRGFPFSRALVKIHDTASDSNTNTSDTTVSNQLRPSNRVQVVFQVMTQKHCLFDTPAFSGTFKTKQQILSQDILFKPGQPFSQKEIEISQQRLLSRAYISDVRIGEPLVMHYSEKDSSLNKSAVNPQGNHADSVDVVTVPFVVTDKSGMGIDGVLGYQSQDRSSPLSGFLTITMLNILHRGESVSLFYRGEKTLQQFNFTIEKPYPFLLPLFLTSSFSLEIESADYGYLEAMAELVTQLKGFWQIGGAVKGHETTINKGSTSESWNYYGIDFVLKRQQGYFNRSGLSRKLTVRTGSGIANRKTGKYTRWHVDFRASSYVSLLKNHAFAGRFVTQAITTSAGDTLHRAEKFRVGGHTSVRGYTENQFPFSTVAYAQLEYHFFFIPTGSFFIFMDGGVGFEDELTLKSAQRTDLFGYGVGIRMPVKIGRISLAWARNIQEKEGLGRIHIRIQNTISSGDLW